MVRVSETHCAAPPGSHAVGGRLRADTQFARVRYAEGGSAPSNAIRAGAPAE